MSVVCCVRMPFWMFVCVCVCIKRLIIYFSDFFFQSLYRTPFQLLSFPWQRSSFSLFDLHTNPNLLLTYRAICLKTKVKKLSTNAAAAAIRLSLEHRLNSLRCVLCFGSFFSVVYFSSSFILSSFEAQSSFQKSPMPRHYQVHCHCYMYFLFFFKTNSIKKSKKTEK